MERTISVKGVGKVSLSPDLCEVRFSLCALEKEYGQTVKSAERQLEGLRKSLLDAGFAKKMLKTENMSVNASYKSERGSDGNYRSVFEGYLCRHELLLSFPFDSKRLSKVLYAVTESLSEPGLNISFTVKDREKARTALLENAAKDAKRNAETLARASGVKLGELLSVSYGENDLPFRSRTNFTAESVRMAKNADFSVTPEDIRLEESVLFVFGIE